MRLFLLAFCFIISLNAAAQVRDIRANIENDQSDESSFSTCRGASSSSSSSYSPPELGDGLAEFLLGNLFYYTAYGVYKGLAYGQWLMQTRREKYPEIFSLEANLRAGFDFRQNTQLLSPSLKGNWGLFATELYVRAINDVTGRLHTLDWQVLKLRCPISQVKVEYGLGFSHVFSPSKTYFDQSAGVEWCLLNRKLTLQGACQWSQKTTLGARYRQEGRVQASYELAQSGRFRFAPSLGFVDQDFFGTTRFRFWQLGLRIQLF